MFVADFCDSFLGIFTDFWWIVSILANSRDLRIGRSFRYLHVRRLNDRYSAYLTGTQRLATARPLRQTIRSTNLSSPARASRSAGVADNVGQRREGAPQVRRTNCLQARLEPPALHQGP